MAGSMAAAGVSYGVTKGIQSQTGTVVKDINGKDIKTFSLGEKMFTSGVSSYTVDSRDKINRIPVNF